MVVVDVENVGKEKEMGKWGNVIVLGGGGGLVKMVDGEVLGESVGGIFG